MSKYFAGLVLTLVCQAAWPVDACTPRSIQTSANVTVSDGSSFRTESYFRSKDAAAIRHIDDDNQIVVVEGPYAWMRRGDHAALGPEFFKIFALGHQYHAFLLYFDQILANVRDNADIEVSGDRRSGKTGDYPFGGFVHWIDGTEPDKPYGVVFEFPDSPPIVTTFHEWREAADRSLPFHARIDDGSNVFDYRYEYVDLSPQQPEWFASVVGAPTIDEVLLYRLYYGFVTALCAADSDREIELGLPDIEISGARDTAIIRSPGGSFSNEDHLQDGNSSPLTWVLTAAKVDGEWEIKAASRETAVRQ